MKRSTFTAAVKRILKSEPFYEVLRTDPERAKASVYELFMERDFYSGDSQTIREYFKELNTKGWIEWEKEDETD